MIKLKKTYVIAEAGVNHNNKISFAFKLIEAAKKAGADAIKFQVFKTENYVAKNAPLAKYQKKNTSIDNQFNLIKDLELSEDKINKIIKYCKLKKITFLASAFDTWGVKFLKKKKIKTFKIPSGEINNFNYLEEVSQAAKHIILSTGMSTQYEVHAAVKFLFKKKFNKKNITILQCNTEYPTPYKDLNLNVIKNFKKKLKVNVGLSDHSLGDVAPIMAVTLGASVIEKHITLNKNLIGPDHKASMEPIDFANMVKKIRIAETALGTFEKKPTKSEKKNISIARKSIYAARFIKKGQIFTKKNIILKRPATGINAGEYNNILGKKAIRDFEIDNLIKI